jgi:EAL domain-containing protein (putative c-di-GMP-specific phosphodiesterase class I)
VTKLPRRRLSPCIAPRPPAAAATQSRPGTCCLAVERLTLETELRHAIERHDFTLVYQPIVELLSSDICGLEAFVRWTRPGGRVIGPADFIPVAEETGLIVPLTYSVLGNACSQAAAWQRMFGQPLGISVNISSRVFSRGDFVDEVERALEVSGLLPGTLRVEITENTLLTSSDVVHRNFERLHDIHVAVYLDDFGTGYSSLSSLQRYRWTRSSSIDRSSRAWGRPTGCAIGGAIVKLATRLGIGLIAEGSKRWRRPSNCSRSAARTRRSHPLFSSARPRPPRRCSRTPSSARVPRTPAVREWAGGLSERSGESSPAPPTLPTLPTSFPA